ncbi:MAG: hypothetical protein QOF71_1298 [Candidatus Eremiobacteraeota bacterium]|jgi:hypothetical protein|nr:hypothetical protein [Candidatus Eremiobacteraeota bacterium]
MFLLLPIIVALAADPTPGPSSAARPTPLTEIGRVRALPACVPIVAHANGAITDALENDRTLSVIATNLRGTDFDKLNFIQRRNTLERMLRQAEAIAKAAKAGDAEVKRLREYAVNSPDPKRKEELKTFADALGGAIYRQQKAAVEVQRDILIMRNRDDALQMKEIINDDALSPPVQQRGTTMLGTPTPRPLRPTPSPDPEYDRHYKFLAQKLDVLNEAILRDEGVAQDHSIAATSGC